ncbi:MAG: type II toxin-antitoxin system RelE/ParE family toxin [Methylococcales bacterium]|nr:type II toxin-antitoxin system RelE/ParE family toxin [Methylococcales bacterium]
MTWKIDFDRQAFKALSKLDSVVKKRIVQFLENLELVDNPRQQGKALTGKFKGLWRYRVGDYRLICNIEDEQIIILVLDVAHRKQVYKN